MRIRSRETQAKIIQLMELIAGEGTGDVQPAIREESRDGPFSGFGEPRGNRIKLAVA
jgi:hypothetical protein